ncbi:hypothetical protein BJ875DRAFT_457347 [Amylocarpus encephaloides]|uniref:Smr domain-containing protein n=1 Tax=Amylocarpus encephaloides TaxID=45428 RepID=A0A9P7YM18_9HELO|nr:hypothetical protein BJ875DRAFT_457347 [Amylocarpus encephaloides]
MKDIEDLPTRLIDEYSKTIDSSTLLAILSDFNISNPEELGLARQTLDILKDAVPDEEVSVFDASGASAPELLIEGSIDATENESRSGSAPTWTSQNSQTDATSLELGMSLLDLEGLDFAAHTAPSSQDELPEKSYTSELDGLDILEKERALIGIFPILKPFDVQWTLKKYKGDASLAIDELMTQSFLEETGSRYKGIEAFAESEIPAKPRKGKGKKKKTRVATAINGGPVLEPPIQNKWSIAKEDIQFIVFTTGMSEKQAGSLYHNNNASLKATIQALVEAYQAMNIDTDDPMTRINAFDLRTDFPTISTSDLESIVQLTRPSLANARSLAERLVSSSSSGKDPIQLEFRHAPIDLSSNEPSPVTPASEISSAQDHPLGSAASYTKSRNSAFDKAAVYHRQGKSSPLMAAAAAYYAEEGRNYDALAKKAASAQADSLVADQSSRTELDLHGVSVKDALRIVRERVVGWWHELDQRKAPGLHGGYRIVTGVGKHSEGGRGKLGPAVGKMLIREGWEVEVKSGYMVVRGLSSPASRRG